MFLVWHGSLGVLDLAVFLSYDGSDVTVLNVSGASISLIVLVSSFLAHLEHRDLRLAIILITLVFPEARVLPSRVIGAPLISRLKGKIVCLLVHTLVKVEVFLGIYKLSLKSSIRLSLARGKLTITAFDAGARGISGDLARIIFGAYLSHASVIL